MKAQKGIQTIPNRHLHSRISYLYQAATYLAGVHHSADGREERRKAFQDNSDDLNMKGNLYSISLICEDSAEEPEPPNDSLACTSKPSLGASGLSRHLLYQLRSVSLKSQVRLSQDMKRSICNRCHTLLTPGITSSDQIENKSRGGSKPWADVLCVTCTTCGAAKRFPVGAQRQQKRCFRSSSSRKPFNKQGQTSR